MPGDDSSGTVVRLFGQPPGPREAGEPEALPAPNVIEVALVPKPWPDADRLWSALRQLQENDPSLGSETDIQTGHIFLQARDEDHLVASVDRLMKDSAGAAFAGPVQIMCFAKPVAPLAAEAFHERTSQGVRETGFVALQIFPDDGAREVVITVDPLCGGEENEMMAGAIRGVRSCLGRDAVVDHPLGFARIVIRRVERCTSPLGAEIAARMAMRKAIRVKEMVTMEPAMRLSVTCPAEFSGGVIGDVSSRRGTDILQARSGEGDEITALVPMINLFSYRSTLGRITGGSGRYTMRFDSYQAVPPEIDNGGSDDFRPAAAMRA